MLYVDGEMANRLLKERLADEANRLGLVPAGFHALSHEDVENFAPLNTPLQNHKPAFPQTRRPT
jgi:hypothetical protein